MDRRNFLRTASSFALLAAGATTGVSRVFAKTPSFSLTGNQSDENTPNMGDTMEYRNSEDWMYRPSVWAACRWWVITVGSTTKRI